MAQLSVHPQGLTGTTMEHMRVRRATLDDYWPVLSVADGLYGGIDYLPTMFHEFLHSKKHLMVVMEDKRTGTIVGLLAFELMGERRGFVMGFAARIRPSLQGNGVWKSFRRLARDLSLAEEPAAKTGIFVSPLNDTFRLTKIYYIWNCLFYKFSVDDLPHQLRCPPSRTGSGSSSGPVRRVCYAESTERLARDDSFQNFFRQFANEFIPCDCNRHARQISREGLRELFAKSELFISEISDSQTAADGGLDPTVRRRMTGRDPASEEILAVSYLASLPVECGLGVQTFIYGFDVELVVRHLHSHLSHVGRIWNGQDGLVAIMVQVPICIDMNRLEERLHKTVGDAFVQPKERHPNTVLGSSMPYWPSTYHAPKSKL